MFRYLPHALSLFVSGPGGSKTGRGRWAFVWATVEVHEPSRSARETALRHLRIPLAQRNPLLLFVFDGLLLLRFAHRRLFVLLFHEPPRSTRLLNALSRLSLQSAPVVCSPVVLPCLPAVHDLASSSSGSATPPVIAPPSSTV